MNSCEREVANELAREGWTVLNRGWPDFLAVRGKELMFIEVKPNPCDDDESKLSVYQKAMREALARIGVHVWIMGPGGVTEMAELDRALDEERQEEAEVDRYFARRHRWERQFPQAFTS